MTRSQLRTVLFDTKSASFLAGYVAAGTTQTGVVGTFGGVNIPPVTDFMEGMRQGVEYYKGSDWSEGSQTAKTRLKLPPGEYRLSLTRVEADVDWTGGRLASQMQATVYQGVANTMWLWGVAALLGTIGGAFLLGRVMHNARRWSGSDWSDD